MSSSLTATLERINAMRKKAMDNPEFIDGAKEHSKAILREQTAQSINDKPREKKSRKTKVAPYSSLYAHLNEKPLVY